MTRLLHSTLGCPCGRDLFETIHVYHAPPAGETRFRGAEGYRRELRRCEGCGHIVSVCLWQSDGLYCGEYVDATYGVDGIHDAFLRITSLEPGASDNVGRVRRVEEFMKARRRQAGAPPALLDVGSGLGVFPHAMKAAGWRCTALDPDERACRHAREMIGVRAVCARFADYRGAARFDLVTFNKVLEHVEDPAAMLAPARRFLRDDGVVYVEVPDGEMALADGPQREEFFIEHHHAFSLRSLILLAERCGFVPLACERLREPSGKYTLRSFLVTGAPGEGEKSRNKAGGADVNKE